MPRRKDIACPHCGGEPVAKLELPYDDAVVEPDGGILVCPDCLHAVDPDADPETGEAILDDKPAPSPLIERQERGDPED